MRPRVPPFVPLSKLRATRKQLVTVDPRGFFETCYNTLKASPQIEGERRSVKSMRKGWKSFFLTCVAILVMVFISAATCSFEPTPTPTTYSVTVNNAARGSYVDLYANYVYLGRVFAYSTRTFSGLDWGTTLQVRNSGGSLMVFEGGNNFYRIYSNVTFVIPSGGIWVTAERD